MLTTRCSQRLLATLFLVVTSSCGDSLAPGELGREYLLVNVANDDLPTVLQTTEYGTIRVLSQHIWFGAKGAGSVTETMELVPHAADEPRLGPTQHSFLMNWRQNDGRVEIEFDCPPDANCIAGPHLIAFIDGHSLRATWGPRMSGRTPLHYEEVVAAQ